MERWAGKIAVVTGCSSGIGAAIAKDLVKKGVNVVAVARRLDRLQELKKETAGEKGKLYHKKADVSIESEIKDLFNWVKEAFGAVHILVNNAGLTRIGKLTEQDPNSWREIFNLNVIGLSICTQEALKLMKTAGINDGHIVNINSILGHGMHPLPEPIVSMYSVSKNAVTQLTEALRQELLYLKTNIKITSVSPGVVASEFHVAAIASMPDQQRPPIDQFRNRPRLSSEDVSDAVMYVLSTPPHVQIHELMLRPTGQST